MPDYRLSVPHAGSGQDIAQALAAAIEASTDPAVVRFREEHWRPPLGMGVTGMAELPPGSEIELVEPRSVYIAARLDALELAKSTPLPFPPELLAEWRDGTGRPNARALQELRDYAAELRDAAQEVCDALPCSTGRTTNWPSGR